MKRNGLVFLLGSFLLSTMALPAGAQSRITVTTGRQARVGASFTRSGSFMPARGQSSLNPLVRGHLFAHPIFQQGSVFDPGESNLLHFRNRHLMRVKFRHKPFFGHVVLPIFLFPQFVSVGTRNFVLATCAASIPTTGIFARDELLDQEAAIPRPGTEPLPEGDLVALVLKSGSVYLATRYWLEGGRIFFVTPDSVEASVPLDELDLETTVQLNANRGVEFSLRPASKQTVARPEKGSRHIYVPIPFPQR